MENVINLTESVCINRAPNTSGFGYYPSELLQVSENESHSNKIAAINKKTSQFIPYNSYLSQINVKPIDQPIPTTIQCDQKKMEAVKPIYQQHLQCDQNKKEPSSIAISDSDDELCMWVDEPVVVDLVSSDDENTGHGKKMESKANLKHLKGEDDNIVVNNQQGGPHHEDTVGTTVAAEVNTASSDTVSSELNSLVTSPLSVTAGDVNTGTSKETSDAVPPELNSTAHSPLSVTTFEESGDTRETSDTVSPEFSSIVTSPPSDLHIHSVESLHHVVSSPKTAVSASHSTATSPDHVAGPIVDLLDYQVATPSRIIPHTLKRSHDLSESKNIDCIHRHATNNKSTISTSSERYAINKKDRSKKRKLLADDRFYDASAVMRPHSKKKDVDRQTFAPSNHRKSNSLTSKKDTNSSQKQCLHSDTYDSSRHSRIRSSPTHSRLGSSTIQRTAENQNTCEGYGHRDSGVEQKLVSEAVSVVSESKSENLADEMSKRSGSSDNRFSRPFRDYRWEAILISRENARPLLSTVNGYNFLNDAFQNYRVQLRMNWAKHNHVLWVLGTEVERTRFNKALAKFFERETREAASQSTVSNGFESKVAENDSFETQSPGKRCDGSGVQLPKKKIQLVFRIEENLGLLNEYLGNPEHLFDSITKNETVKTKGSTKRVIRMRKDLNIILMGQAGLRDGPMHLASLKRFLRTVKNITADLINKKIVSVIETHFNYIFSSYKHHDYPALIAEYKALRRSDSSSTLAMNMNPQAVAPKTSDEDAQQAFISTSTE